jgi:phosphate transport system permease protein
MKRDHHTTRERGLSSASAQARRRRVLDRAGEAVAAAAGIGVIFGVLAILGFLAFETAPLFRSVEVRPGLRTPLSGPEVSSIAVDDYRSRAFVLGGDGSARAIDLAGGSVLERIALAPPDAVRTAQPLAADAGFLVLDDAGEAHVALALFDMVERAGGRDVTPRLSQPVRVALGLDGDAPTALAARASADVVGIAAALGSGPGVLVERTLRRNFLTGEPTETLVRRLLPLPAGTNALALDAAHRNLFAGTRDGRVLWLPLAAAGAEPQIAAGDGEVRAIALLASDRTAVVANADGALGAWFVAVGDDGTRRLVGTGGLPPLAGAPRLLASTSRSRVFAALDASDQLSLYESTSRQLLWREPSPLPGATALAFAPRGDAVLLASQGEIVALEVRAQHVAVSLGTLFGRVWYEGYPEPAWVWQSSSGSNDSEPKLSLVPLVFGTLKGTFWSLLLAVPLGVLGALYASQLMHPTLRNLVKPVVELSAALPSVVLGFLAGLWLAPRVERVFPAIALATVALPLAAIAGGFLWSRLPRRFVGRLPDGSELAAALGAIGLTAAACLGASGAVEGLAFGGHFQSWLMQAAALPYDQRNAVVVGLAMGFAVVPIVFSVAEDAFSNVPRTLVAGSLALGATRWQTVSRVVLPAAAPGVFSAIVLGLGRAVGETMIVLMASGNTPLLDWNPFNGFRTLSANIAVEIPEAPLGGTLYRTLFLSALLLFGLTFVLNTAAELARQRLRRRLAGL